MIRHVVAWKLAASEPDQKEADAAEIVRLLQSLVGVVPSIVSLTVGANMAYFDANWDVVLVADYESLAGLEEYQTHPAHLEVLPQIRARVAERAAVDIEL